MGCIVFVMTSTVKTNEEKKNTYRRKRTETLMLYITKKEKAALKRYAEANRCSMTTVVRSYLASLLTKAEAA